MDKFEKLGPDLIFTVENKTGKLYKISGLTFQT